MHQMVFLKVGSVRLARTFTNYFPSWEQAHSPYAPGKTSPDKNCYVQEAMTTLRLQLSLKTDYMHRE